MGNISAELHHCHGNLLQNSNSCKIQTAYLVSSNPDGETSRLKKQFDPDVEPNALALNVCADHASRVPQLPLTPAGPVGKHTCARQQRTGNTEAATRFNLVVFRSYPVADKLGRYRQQASLYACVMEKWRPFPLPGYRK